MGKILELTTVELNPRWTIPVAKDLTFGVGPGIGWVKADGGRNVDLFAWQAGADLNYRVGQLNLGLGARWQDTLNKNLGGGREGADNWLVSRPRWASRFKRPQGRAASGPPPEGGKETWDGPAFP